MIFRPMVWLALASCACAQEREKEKPEKLPVVEEEMREPPAAQPRTQLNLLGRTDSKSGESRPNENVQVNLVDNNTRMELN